MLGAFRKSPVNNVRLIHNTVKAFEQVKPIDPPSTDGAAGSKASPKITAIVDEIAKLTLIETSQLVEAIKEKPAEKSEFTIKLEKFDAAQKAKVIREIKALLPNLNLVAAKKFVEESPKVVRENVPKEEAEKIKATLEAVGATVVLE
ncbi:54S ribosomal protein L12, mitochondrial [Zancudomyces culisetae]|uniref:54S ribosomal protein L12, mitochondrial n=1 Tax=Zancudomyces culisetae TaxID=1213189 RepID=A0A1R1PYC6_ZANCU|nr:54S ribosomal protein L12, mitochondrial [Zancudomyces culisetae]|eukprot:OMH85955.1 54S ribosomal protein L12, mitochondrial [Zancudomyces culisetae]